MAKSKKNNRNSKKSTVKVQDMAPEQNPKGGALNPYLKLNGSDVQGEAVLPAVQLDSRYSK